MDVNWKFNKVTKIDLPRIIAHRGASGHAPENTLASVKKAAELKVKWIECDVMLTADKKAIIFHDKQLKRTTNGRGYIARTSYADIATLDAGSWFSPLFLDERVPTLVELIKCLKDHQLNANIEIKPTMGTEKETALSVVTTLREYWPPHLPKPLISSFKFETLMAVREADPEAMIGLLLSRWQSRWYSQAERINAVSVHINEKRLTQKRVSEIKQRGLYVLAYTVNDPRRAAELFSFGVDSVFSDYPDKVGVGLFP